MKTKFMQFVVLGFVLALLAGCASTTLETRTVSPDGTYTVESQETTTPAVAYGEPYVGIGTPWYFDGNEWFYNGVLFGFYGPYGWGPFGFWGPEYIVRPFGFYGNPYYRTWYGSHPECGRYFHEHYGSGNRYHGEGHHPGAHGEGHHPGAHGEFHQGHQGSGHNPQVHNGNTHQGQVRAPQHQQQQRRSAPPRSAPRKK